VRHAAIGLTQHALYPSAGRIADLLNDRNVMRSRTGRAAWREVLSDSAGIVPVRKQKRSSRRSLNANDLNILHRSISMDGVL
jgi:hypothetical protein